MTIFDAINDWYDSMDAITTSKFYAEYQDWSDRQVDLNNDRHTLVDYILTHVKFSVIAEIQDKNWVNNIENQINPK